VVRTGLYGKKKLSRHGGSELLLLRGNQTSNAGKGISELLPRELKSNLMLVSSCKEERRDSRGGDRRHKDRHALGSGKLNDSSKKQLIRERGGARKKGSIASELFPCHCWTSRAPTPLVTENTNYGEKEL